MCAVYLLEEPEKMFCVNSTVPSTVQLLAVLTAKVPMAVLPPGNGMAPSKDLDLVPGKL